MKKSCIFTEKKDGTKFAGTASNMSKFIKLWATFFSPTLYIYRRLEQLISIDLQG